MVVTSRDKPFTLGDWRIEPELDRIVRADQVIKIDPQHMRLLLLLAARPGAVVSQQEIEAEIWGDVVVTPNSVYQGIAQLRRVLGDDKNRPRYIETIARRGYRLVTSPVPTEVVELGRSNSVLRGKQFGGSWGTPLRQDARAAGVLLLGLLGVAVGLLVYSQSQRLDPAIVPNQARLRSHSSSDQYEELLIAAQESSPEISASQAKLLLQLADWELRNGLDRRARMHLEKAVSIQRELSGHKFPQLALMLSKLAFAYTWNSDLVKAEAAARESVALIEKFSPEVHPNRVNAYWALGVVLQEEERFSESEIYLQRALNLSKRIYGEQSISTIDARRDLADLRLAQGRLDEAEVLIRGALQDYLKWQRSDKESVFYFEVLGAVLLAKGQHTVAIAVANTALAILDQAGQPNNPHAFAIRHLLSECLIGLGKYQEAEHQLRQIIQLLSDTQSEPWRIARAKSVLGEALLEQGQLAEAETYIIAALKELQSPGNWSQKQALLKTEARMEKLRLTQARKTSS